MQIAIERKLTRSGYSFQVLEFQDLVGISNYTFGILRRRMNVYTNSGTNIRYSAKQKHIMLSLINRLPILNQENITPFKILSNGQFCGVCKKDKFYPSLTASFENAQYELCLHNGGLASLVKDQRQIALFKKEVITLSERNHYTVIAINDRAHDRIALLLFFCMLLDAVFYPNRGEITMIKREMTFITANDKYPERATWNPDDQ